METTLQQSPQSIPGSNQNARRRQCSLSRIYQFPFDIVRQGTGHQRSTRKNLPAFSAVSPNRKPTQKQNSCAFGFEIHFYACWLSRLAVMRATACEFVRHSCSCLLSEPPALISRYSTVPSRPGPSGCLSTVRRAALEAGSPTLAFRLIQPARLFMTTVSFSPSWRNH